MEALYRKYRPKNFYDIVGQEHIKKLLTNALKLQKINHAYIFAGPRGTGKTTTARILAKSLNCEKNQFGEPCNECTSCQAIDNGSHLDVIELDAASNRGIDEIRKIKEGVNFTPVMGKYKVYIIDEVHMLTREAFNALLKTLEEPPQHIVFILATTNPEKIPPTIMSRCHVLEFRNISEENIISKLKSVCEKEGFDVTYEALKKIAKRAEGGLRDALSTLEQVIRYTGGEVTEKIVDEALGLISEETIEKFIEATLNNDRELIEKILNDIYIERGDFDTFINQLLEKTLEKKEDNMLKLASDFYNVLKEIRFAEEKLLIARLMFLSIANRYYGKYSNISNVSSASRSSQDNVGTKQLSKNIQDEKITEQNENTLPQSEKMPSAQLNESVKNEDIQVDLKREEKEEKHLSQNVSQAKFLKQVTKELLEELKLNGDLSIFVGLSLATVYENEDSIKIVFDKSKQFSYEVIKEKKQEIELLYKNKSGLNRPVEVILSDDVTDPVLEKLKILFDDNKSSLRG